jgi:lipopolysaccharide biosynthesis glycosyltransferase/glycosyltransferase involved in cell wall biosynthesis
MNILIARANIFSRLSGVDRFYRHVVVQHPQARFTVLQNISEASGQSAPPNVDLMPFLALAGPCLVPRDSSWIHEFLARAAHDIAASVPGRSFDVVDTSSTVPIAHLLPAAFAQFGVQFDRIAVGLHGWTSDALANEFARALPATTVADFAVHEALALEAADVRYAFSPMCIIDAHERTKRKISRLAPTDAFEARSPVRPPPPSNAPVDIVQIGAVAGYKGGDLLISCLRDVPKSVVKRVIFAGRAARFGSPERDAAQYLREHAANYNVDVVFVDSPSDAWIEQNVYFERAIVALASRPRSETFGFSAAEALMLGIPILLSRHAGLADVLRDQWPWLPTTIFSPDDVAGAPATIERLAAEYDERRAILFAKLIAQPLPKPNVNFLASAYTSTRDADRVARQKGNEWFHAVRFATRRFGRDAKPPLHPLSSSVRIVFTIDDTMAAVAAVAIASIAARCSPDRRYVITIMYFALTDDSKKLLVLAAGSAVMVTFLAATLPAGLMPAHAYWPSITFLRLTIPSVLSLDERVIYLDADVVVLNDIAELFDHDLAKYSLGAVRDECITEMPSSGWPSSLDSVQCAQGRYFWQQVELDKSNFEGYFPSNVLLMDVERMRANRFVERACAFFEQKSRRLRYGDQDILNHLFQGDYCALHPRWNVFAKYGTSAEDDRGAAILHFASPDRPWINPRTPGAEIFWREVDNSPVSAVVRSQLAKESNDGVVNTPASVVYGDPQALGRWLNTSEARSCLSVYGWSLDETEGAWIVVEPTTLYIPVASLPGAVSISIEGFTIAAATGQTAKLAVGSLNSVVPILEGQEHIDLSCRVPPGTRLIGGRFLDTKLYISGFVVPAEQGWSHDIRLLRFFVKRIKIDVSWDGAA